VGTGLAIAALPILVVFSSLHGGVVHIVGFSVFGLSLITLYITSTLYHGVSNSRLKATFRKLDHMSIFLLIAGSYTPFCLTALPGWIGWTVLSIVWICALLGMVIKIFYTGHQEKLSTFFYILMGWLIIPAIDPLYHAMSVQSFVMLLLGGIFYTCGTVFFLNDRKQYFHSIWHLFVLAGSTLHFFSVLGLLSD
jgi:hemolysin III